MLREDNADVRLTPRGRELRLVDDERWQFFEAKQQAVAAEVARFEGARLHPAAVPTEWSARVLGQDMLARDCTAMELLRRPEVSYHSLLELIGAPDHAALDDRLPLQVQRALEVRAGYSGYIDRAQEEIARAERNENTALPSDLNYARLGGLSNEIRQKLSEIRPATLGQAARVPGVTPAAVSILLVHLKKLSRAI
jgi:tRNA uridine 5-carboxymethylaminomethyl modification enzyme